MEFYRLCPPGVSVHITRSSVPHEGGVTLAEVLGVAEGQQFVQLATDLATVRPHAVARMCTSGSFSRGLGRRTLPHACTAQWLPGDDHYDGAGHRAGRVRRAARR